MLLSLVPWLVGEAVQEGSMKATSTRSSVQCFVVGMLTSFSKGHPTLSRSPMIERILPFAFDRFARGAEIRPHYSSGVLG